MAYTPQNPNGQAIAAASSPVVLASNQSAVPVTGPLTDTQLRTTPVAISGSIANTSFSVNNNGVVSTVNSSAVALGIGALFTGSSEDVTEQADVRVSVFTDQASAVDGLQLQQSSNGTNWDIVDSYTVPANAGKTFSVGVSAKFFRVVYTNGGVAQTLFRLQVKYHKTYSKGSSVRPQDARTNDNDMEEQLAHLLGFNGVSWDRLRSTVANGLAVDVTRLPALVTGAAVIGALVANQSVNKAQINGVVPLMGNGITGTGSQRVTIASDNTAFPVNATLAAETTKIIGTVNSSVKATYRASTIIPLVAAVTVNVPFLNIIGSATKTITVKRIRVSGMTLTAVGYFAINVEKLSSASTLGTFSTLVATSLDTNNAVVTAVVKAYTAAPTKGTLVGTIASHRTLWQATVAAAAGVTDDTIFEFGNAGDVQGVVLRGAAQELAMTFPVVLASAGTLAISIEWTEE